jgi:hypothetical protein
MMEIKKEQFMLEQKPFILKLWRYTMSNGYAEEVVASKFYPANVWGFGFISTKEQKGIVNKYLKRLNQHQDSK